MDFNIKRAIQFKAKNKVGLDLGKSAIKILEIQSIGDKNTLVHIGLKKLPDPSRETLIDSIDSLVKELNISVKEANVSVSGPSTIVRFVSMPRMRDDELKGAVEFEAEKHIPFPIEDCILDYQILKKDEKENKLDVLLVAVKKALVLEKIAVVEECGFGIGVVDVDTFAVTNSFLKNFSGIDPEKTAALLDIGAGITNVSVVQKGILRFSRDVAIGGAEFSAAISKGLNLDPKAAEEIKIAPGTRLQDVANCTKNVTNNLIDELRLSFSYYENQSGKGIDEIYISGGAAGTIGLEAIFQEAFDLKPFFWDPLKFLDVSGLTQNADLLKDMNRSFAVAAGLAIR